MTRLALVVLLVSGCTATDPYERAGMWQPTGANSRNLAAMVVSPYDLIRGHGERGFSGIESAVPVTQLWAGKTAPLPAAGSQQPAGGPNTPAAAAPN